MKKETFLLIGFIVLKFLLQFGLMDPAYDLHRDEYLYLDQGQHLAWGFLSVPPLTSWVSALIHALGNGVFWVRFFPALFGAATIFLVWKAIKTLGGNLFALTLGATGVLLSSLLRLNGLYQPNSFDVLCWTGCYFVMIQYFRTGHAKWLFTAAVCFALGVLNKYNIVFLLCGLVPGMLLTPQRKVFLQPKVYAAGLLSVILILPNLLWQYHNHFPVIRHMAELTKNQLVHVDRLGFLKSQLLFFMGAVPVIIAALYALLVYKPFKPYRCFFWSMVFTLATFTYFKAKDYYAIGIYPIYIAFGAVYLGNLWQGRRKIYLRAAVMVIPVLLFIPIYNIAFPNKSPEYIVQHQQSYKAWGMLRWEDGKDHQLPQDFSDMLGWKELAEHVDRTYATLPNKNETLILCDNYGQAGAINYYTKQNVQAVSFNADYINWIDGTKHYTNLIRVKENNSVATELAETAPYFENSWIAGSITDTHSREYGTTIFAFTGANIDINQRIQAEIDENKNGH
ncbi:glycosyltransferase family 39 protein [Flavobacterium sp.]|uniref:ArnT family glycosyltransferase n=1 Tax=Flavobacterium sp. TaxID=239 RepID=UPI002604ECC1|nr:glycosyltransferase family 39 protein [Flavobacterium sp.]